jgi:homopolymeric O-antigen transport system ATP-binding protein
VGTASIVADRIRIEYPILNSMNRSLKRRFVSAATGGLVAHDARDHIVVTALDGVSLSIAPGERVALVGHNGSGKSTLLRSIAGVYRPIAGELRVQGTISTLFDISTGFDLEATGSENVVLRGLVMGLTRAQIAQRMSEIREFSGLGDYLDLPIRTYSTGMLLRLAFGVATSVQRDIVLMDEWLAVGDAEFSERAEHRLHDHLSRTSILVLATHSDELVRNVCNRRIELKQGRVVSDERIGDSR